MVASSRHPDTMELLCSPGRLDERLAALKDVSSGQLLDRREYVPFTHRISLPSDRLDCGTSIIHQDLPSHMANAQLNLPGGPIGGIGQN